MIFGNDEYNNRLSLILYENKYLPLVWQLDIAVAVLNFTALMVCLMCKLLTIGKS